MTTELKHLINSIKYIDKITEDLIIIIKKECICEYVSKSACLEDLGYKTNDFIDFIEIIHPSDRELATKFIEIIFKNGNGNEELRFKHKNGHVIWYDVKGNSFKNECGEDNAILISRNIMKFKPKENAEDEGNVSKEKYRNIINHLDLGFFKTDMDGTITEHNPKLNEILGYHLKETLIGINARDLWVDDNELKGYGEKIRNQISCFKII